MFDPAFQTDKQNRVNPTTSNQRGLAETRSVDQEAGFEKLLDFCSKLLEIQYKILMPSTSSFDRQELKRIIINIPSDLYQTTAEHQIDNQGSLIPERKETDVNKEDKNKGGNPPSEMPLQDITGRIVPKKSKHTMNDSLPAKGRKKATKLKKNV